MLLGAVGFVPCATSLRAQTPDTATQSLLDKAHDFELRGHLEPRPPKYGSRSFSSIPKTLKHSPASPPFRFA